MKLALFLFMMTQFNSSSEVCTTDAHKVVDDVFDIVQSFEKDPLHPDPVPMKEILGTVQTLLHDCFNLDIDLVRYEKCVDDLMPVFPQI